MTFKRGLSGCVDNGYTHARGTVGVTSIAGPVDAFRVRVPPQGMGRDRTRVTPHSPAIIDMSEPRRCFPERNTVSE